MDQKKMKLATADHNLDHLSTSAIAIVLLVHHLRQWHSLSLYCSSWRLTELDR
jgi:hypothetical protein